MHADRRGAKDETGETVPMSSGPDLTNAAWRSAAEEMKAQFPALRECFPERKGFADLWRFRESWGLDDARGRGAAVVASAWVAWEFCGLSAWIRGQADGESQDAGVRIVAWRRLLARHFWDAFLVAAADARREAFEGLAGADASLGAPPPLEPAMESAERGLLVETADLWLRQLDAIEAAANVPESERDRVRLQARALKVQMVEDLRTVVIFEANPAHWEPTPDQLARLPAHWRRRFEFKEALSRYVGARHNPPQDVADARHALALLRAEMAAAAPRVALR
jgi:hypothetical protein